MHIGFSSWSGHCVQGGGAGQHLKQKPYLHVNTAFTTAELPLASCWQLLKRKLFRASSPAPERVVVNSNVSLSAQMPEIVPAAAEPANPTSADRDTEPGGGGESLVDGSSDGVGGRENLTILPPGPPRGRIEISDFKWSRLCGKYSAVFQGYVSVCKCM